MKNTVLDDLALYSERLEAAKEKLRDAQFDLKRAREDVRSSKVGAKRANSKPVRDLVEALGPAVTNVSLVACYVYIQTENVSETRIPSDFVLDDSRRDPVNLFVTWVEYRGSGDLSFVRIVNKYDQRKVVL